MCSKGVDATGSLRSLMTVGTTVRVARAGSTNRPQVFRAMCAKTFSNEIDKPAIFQTTRSCGTLSKLSAREKRRECPDGRR